MILELNYWRNNNGIVIEYFKIEKLSSKVNIKTNFILVEMKKKTVDGLLFWGWKSNFLSYNFKINVKNIWLENTLKRKIIFLFNI